MRLPSYRTRCGLGTDTLLRPPQPPTKNLGSATGSTQLDPTIGSDRRRFRTRPLKTVIIACSIGL